MQHLSLIDIVLRAVMAIVVGGFIGRERDAKNRPAGIRTHSLVCLGAALIMMTNLFVAIEFKTGDPTRMGSQVINGIGFLGAGTILVTQDNKIKGLTTAAGIWISSAIGLAIGIGFYKGAIIATLSVWVVMVAMQSLKVYIKTQSKIIDLYLIVSSKEAYNRVMIYCAENKIRISESKTAFGEVSREKLKNFDISDKKISAFLTLDLNEKFDHLRLLGELSEVPGVFYVEEI